MASAQYVLVPSMITDSKRCFLDAKDSGIIYKYNPGRGDVFSPLCQLRGWFALLCCYFIYDIFFCKFFLLLFGALQCDAGKVLAAGCIWPYESRSSNLGC